MNRFKKLHSSNLTNMKHTKIVIIGGGPSGLTAAIYAARAGLTPIVAAGSVLGGLMPGGQLMTTTEVENYPGFPEGITGPELMERFHKQATRFGAQIINEWASDINTKVYPFELSIGSERYTTECIIIATGAVAKWLGLPNEDLYKNNGISACATCDGPLPCYRDAEIHVVGGGDTAMEEALFLTKFASKVTIVYRGGEDKLRASKVMKRRALENPKITFLFHSVITEYVGSEIEGLQALVIQNVVSGECKTEPTGGLFMGIGHEPMTNFLSGTGVKLTSQGYIRNDTVHTSVDGIFTCGDVHDSHYRQAVSAAGFGCMAAIAAERWLTENNENPHLME